MDKDNIQHLIDQTETSMLQLSNQVAELQEVLADLIEDNNQLRMQNKELQDIIARLMAEEEGDVKEEQTSLSTGKERLQSFYDEGIHICHAYFGMNRAPDEECLFCQGILEDLDH